MINRRKAKDIRAYNMAIIEETLKGGGSLKATNKKLAIRTNRIYALRHEQGNITQSMDEIVEVAERFYTRLHASNVIPRDTTEPTSFACKVPLITKEEIGKIFKGTKKGKATGKDGITVDLLKEGGDIVLEKLANYFQNA